MDDFRVITPESDEWPLSLHRYGSAPTKLWVSGAASLAEVCETAVTVMGSRAATEYGVSLASEFGSDFAAAGVPVVSSLAYGVDGVALRGVLAGGGVPVAVKPCGLDILHPIAHHQLAGSIGDAGVTVSMWEPGTVPSRERFRQATRLMVVLSRATVVVEAGARSGVFAGVALASSLGQPVYAVPGPVTSAQSKGTNQLIAERQAHLVTSAADVMKRLS